LIVDARQKKVRYMVVDLDDNELKLDHKKVLIPIGLAELHKEDDDVILSNVHPEQLHSLPDYDKNSLTPEMERTICTTLGRNKETMTSTDADEQDSEFYRHDYFSEDNLYKHRLHEAKPSDAKSEYEQGLRLWEKRSEGGVLPDNSGRRESYREKEVEENARMEMVRNRRNAYEQRRGGTGRDNYRRRDNTIEGRIRDEGLQGA
jgi:hypothetical protein